MSGGRVKFTLFCSRAGRPGVTTIASAERPSSDSREKRIIRTHFGPDARVFPTRALAIRPTAAAAWRHAAARRPIRTVGCNRYAPKSTEN